MPVQMSFGNGGNALQRSLSSTDPHYVGDAFALNGGTLASSAITSGETSVGETLTSTQLSVGAVTVPGGTSSAGGNVGFSFQDAFFIITAVDGWNTVKNAKIVSDQALNLRLVDFVQTDVVVTDSSASNIIVQNAKRGNFTTDGGNDTISITLRTNNNDWQNSFDIHAGGGNDTITIGKGSGGGYITDGRFTSVAIDAGSGNDNIDLSAVKLKSASITGGAGNDVMTGSKGADLYNYGIIAGGNSGNDVINSFSYSGGDRIHLGTGLHVSDHATLGGNTLILLSDKTMITVKAVTGYSDAWFV